MNLIFRLFLTFNSTSLILVVYAIKGKILVNSLNPYFLNLHEFVSYTIYIIATILLTYISLKMSKWLKDEHVTAIREIESANDAFLPSYLGYFFVSLGISDLSTLLFVFIIIFAFTFLSQASYFNPVFLLFGYQFYYIITSNGVKNFIISNRLLLNPVNVSFPNLKRINSFTFIDR